MKITVAGIGGRAHAVRPYPLGVARSIIDFWDNRIKTHPGMAAAPPVGGAVVFEKQPANYARIGKALSVGADITAG